MRFPASIGVLMRSTHLSVLLVGCTTAVWAVQVEPVSLRNEHRLHFGELGSVSAGAAVARVTDPSAVWYNPGRLIQTQSPSISGSASIFETATTTLEASDGTYSQSILNSIPGYVGGSGRMPWRDDSRIMWGFGIFVPLYWDSSLENRNTQTLTFGPPSPGPYSVDTVGRVSTQSQLLVPAVAISVRVTDDCGIGLSLMLPYYEHRQERNTSERSQTRGLYRSYWEIQEQTVTSLRVGAGVYHTWGPLDVALAAKSPSWRMTSSSTAEWHSVQASFASGTAVTSDAYIDDGKADFKSPFEATLGVAYTVDAFTAELDATYLAAVGPYTTVEGDLPIVSRVFNTGTGLDITTMSTGTPGDMELEQAWNIAVGAGWGMTTAITLHLGYAIDHSQLENSNEFSDLDISTLSLGLERKTSRSAVFVGAYTQWSNTGTARVFNSQVATWEDAAVSISVWGGVLGASYYLE